MGGTPIAMPQLGMTMREGRVVAWPLAIGSPVAKGETVLVIESEKAEVEVEALATGFLRHVYVEPDATVPCGTLLGAITGVADEAFDADAFRAEHDRPIGGAEPAAEAERPARVDAAPRSAARGRAPITPAARRRAGELGVDPARVAGTGPGGRITVEDVEAAAAPRENLVRVADGVSLEVPREGSGDPVLLLPGFGTDVSVFARQIPALADSHELFGVNPRGVGGSDAPEDEAYPPEQAAADAASVTDAPAHVVGTSLGAAVALEMALRHRDRVRSLALLAPLVRPEGRLLAVVDAWCRLAAGTDPETLAAALLPWFFSAGFLEEAEQRERTRRGLASTLARVPAPSLARTAAGLRAWTPPDASALAALDLPVLVVTGGADLLTPDGERLASAIPKARLLALPEAGHALGLEAPDAVNAVLAEHLASA